MRGHMKLAHALIAKSFAETILVATLAVTFYLSAFPPAFHGWGEVLPHSLSGWAVNQGQPWERLEVQLFIDGKLAASGTANQSRPDVAAAGWARDEWHGYKFEGMSLTRGRHQGRVYALHSTKGGAQQTLQMIGDPIWFDVDEEGALHPLSNVPLRQIR
jgi:hypothetical protein